MLARIQIGWFFLLFLYEYGYNLWRNWKFSHNFNRILIIFSLEIYRKFLFRFTTTSSYNTHFSPYVSIGVVCIWKLSHWWKNSFTVSINGVAPIFKHFTSGISCSFPTKNNTPRHRLVTNLHWNTIKLEEKRWS